MLSGDYATVVFAGDSITEGAVASGVSRTWIMEASARLGVRNPINMGVGSSGYLARRAGGTTLPERLDDVLMAVDDGPPDMVVIAAGINDCTAFPDAQIEAAALGYFQALRAGASGMPIVVFGPFNGPNDAYPAFLATCRDAIFRAAGQVPGTWTVDVADWVTPANRATVFGDPPVSGPHPTDAGHAIYGERAAAAIRAVIEQL